MSSLRHQAVEVRAGTVVPGSQGLTRPPRAWPSPERGRTAVGGAAGSPKTGPRTLRGAPPGLRLGCTLACLLPGHPCCPCSMVAFVPRQALGPTTPWKRQQEALGVKAIHGCRAWSPAPRPLQGLLHFMQPPPTQADLLGLRGGAGGPTQVPQGRGPARGPGPHPLGAGLAISMGSLSSCSRVWGSPSIDLYCTSVAAPTVALSKNRRKASLGGKVGQLTCAPREWGLGGGANT